MCSSKPSKPKHYMQMCGHFHAPVSWFGFGLVLVWFGFRLVWFWFGFGLVWFGVGLGWVGLGLVLWLGLDWFGLGWFGLVGWLVG